MLDPIASPLKAGYNHPDYARSLAEFGKPRHLPGCGGWLLQRSIQGTGYEDGVGCYPMFCCDKWDLLEDDLGNLGKQLITLAMVPDPFGGYELEWLRRSFSIVRPFKEHFVVALEGNWEEQITKHHRYYAKKALREVRVDCIDRPLEFLDEWCEMYDVLKKRHNISGIKGFSRTAFAIQLGLPGTMFFVARKNERILGAQLWFIQGNVGYNHLMAVTEEGYTANVSYALYWESLRIIADRFAGAVASLNLGGGAGVQAEGGGLDWFKSGWSRETKTAFFCGRVLNPEVYAEIVRSAEPGSEGFFPAYRRG